MVSKKANQIDLESKDGKDGTVLERKVTPKVSLFLFLTKSRQEDILCLTKHHNIKTWWGVEVLLDAFLTFFLQTERPSFTHARFEVFTEVKIRGLLGCDTV
jgi:hypothetical protein